MAGNELFEIHAALSFVMIDICCFDKVNSKDKAVEPEKKKALLLSYVDGSRCVISPACAKAMY